MNFNRSVSAGEKVFPFLTPTTDLTVQWQRPWAETSNKPAAGLRTKAGPWSTARAARDFGEELAFATLGLSGAVAIALAFG